MKTSSKFFVASSFPSVGLVFCFWTAAASGFQHVSSTPAFSALGAAVVLLVAGCGAFWAEQASSDAGGES